MRYRYLDDFRRGISVFAIFSYGIAVLDTPQCPPPRARDNKQRRRISPEKKTKNFIAAMGKWGMLGATKEKMSASEKKKQRTETDPTFRP